MADPTELDPVPTPVQYPRFSITVPAGAPVEDIVAATHAAWELAVKASLIPLWLDWTRKPLGLSSVGHNAEELLAELPEDIDRRFLEADRLIAPLRLELIHPLNRYSEGAFHAPCAHEAALQYARDARTRLDFLARIALQSLSGWNPGELLSGAALRGKWDQIARTYRDAMPNRFEGLPSLTSLLNSLTIESTAAMNARIRDADRSALPQRQREVLSALQGRALTLKELAERLGCDPSRLHRDHLKPLVALGHVKRDRKVGGFYRPDEPPTMA